MNSITLDCAEYRIDGGEWRKQKAVIRIMKELLSAGRNVPVELRFYCDIECNPKKLGPIYLAMETCEKYEVTINKKVLFLYRTDSSGTVRFKKQI